jgi:hypothetical protein
MAVIDRRLLPLIELLSASGADWLAFEILDGIRAGRPAEDSDEELSDARRAVSAFRQEGVPLAEREHGQAFVDPIVGDDQIDFSANYVFDRLSDSIQMLESSLAHLDKVVAKPRGETSSPIANGVEISLRIEGSEMAASRTQTRQALTKLAELREALTEWAGEARARENAP